MSQIHTMRFSKLIHPIYHPDFGIEISAPSKFTFTFDLHEHFTWMKWNIQYTTNTHMIENISFSSKQHENLTMSQFSSDRTSQWSSQKAVVVGCLIFSINIGHGMAIAPYNAARSSHSSWTLAQTIRIKILALRSWNYTSSSCQPGNSLSPRSRENLQNISDFCKSYHCCLPQHPHFPEAFMSAFVVQHLRHQELTTASWI